MKTSKTRAFTVTIMSLCIVALTPSTTLAIERSQVGSDTKKTVIQTETPTKTGTTQNRCQAIDKLVAKVQSQLTERGEQVNEKRAAINVKVNQTAEKREIELAVKRGQWDQKRQENFDKLREKAQTDEQREAVETYITTITDAVKKRRAANDAAFATFRSDIEALRTSTNQTVEASVSAVNATISQAAADAQAACEGGQNTDSAKQNLKSKIESARKELQTQRQGIVDSSQLKALVQKRNDAVVANSMEFKTTTQAAREQLKTVFSNTDS